MQWNTIVLNEKVPRSQPWRLGDNDNKKYWFNEEIHTLGNTGILGGLHAAMAPLSTKIIDLLAYNGINVREAISQRVIERLLESKARHKNEQKDCNVRILDLGCGVGMSTMAIVSAFEQQDMVANATVVGIDTSPEMIAMARTKDLEYKGITRLSENHQCLQNRRKSRDTSRFAVGTIKTDFLEANAEETKFSRESFDLVTIMYVLHEVPSRGRDNILREAHRLLRPGGMLAVVDISNEYDPSPSMLSGEPYLQEYQKNFSKQISSAKGFRAYSHEVVVPGHVVAYTLIKKFDPWWKKIVTKTMVLANAQN